MFGAMNVAKPYKIIRSGDIHGPEPYKFIGLRWAFIPPADTGNTRFGNMAIGYLRAAARGATSGEPVTLHLGLVGQPDF